ncbi:MFS transporter [Sulfuracidifex tepidarius]|uniref:Sialic acid transporter n=1 Tax=Sulfuracidifex tepidarius TaxID=1294262 RepID=A0A510E1D4_9CREN|nr:MFS transporter [Sulfuracidifex tepidarius]BBG26305.1 Putative sialic acid transporter [Sulfuracidifex tepidarius]
MRSPLDPLDGKKLNRFHWKTAVVGGMGQFTDGWDLSSASILLFAIAETFHISALSAASSLILSSVIVGNFVGALIFGPIVNKGRKRFYGVDVFLMGLGAIMEAISPNIPTLILSRFILGIGVGADYVLSPLIVAEYANRGDRGKLLTFSGGLSWDLGALSLAIVSVILSSYIPPDLLWRVVMGLGAVPALSVVLARRNLPETPRFLAFLKSDKQAMKKFYGVDVAAKDEVSAVVHLKRSMKMIILSSLTWFLFDMVAYGLGFFSPTEIGEKLGFTPPEFSALMYSLFTIPGALLSMSLVDRTGRRINQSLGFAVMGVSALTLGILFSNGFKSIDLTMVAVAMGLLGMENFFSQVGPGTVVGFWGVELFPTKIRGLSQMFTVLAGRTGAILSAFLYADLFTLGIPITMLFTAIMSLIASVITLTLKEPARESLEVISKEGERNESISGQ